MNRGVKWLTVCIAGTILAAGCDRGGRPAPQRAATQAPEPVKIAGAQSAVAQQVRKYVAAVAQQDAAATKVFLAQDGKDELFYEYDGLVQSGWRYAEDRSRILRESVSHDGAYAVVTAALVYHDGGRLMLCHNDFFLVLEQGAWKVLAMRQAMKLLDQDRTLRQEDYTANLAPPENSAALLDAITQGRESLIRLHLAMGADVNTSGDRTGTVLLAAMNSGNEKIVQLLIDNGADINTVTGDGLTPLILAVRKGREPLVRMLIGKGADVNAQTKGSPSLGAEPSVTALMFAAEQGQEAIVRLLLDNNADVNAKDVNGRTALMSAVEKGYEQIVCWLIERGADTNAQAVDGETALTTALLHMASELGVAEYRGAGKYAAIARLLIDKGADPNALIPHSNVKITVLQSAISDGYDDIACMLIEKGADIRVKSEQQGYSTLMEASYSGRLPVVRLLIAKGADVHERNYRGDTALGFALGNGHDAVARLLMEHGAKPGSAQEEKWAELLRRRAPGDDRATE